MNDQLHCLNELAERSRGDGTCGAVVVVGEGSGVRCHGSAGHALGHPERHHAGFDAAGVPVLWWDVEYLYREGERAPVGLIVNGVEEVSR